MVSRDLEYSFASLLMGFSSVKSHAKVALICSLPHAKLLWFSVMFSYELPCQRFNAKNAAKKLKLTTRGATARTRITAMNRNLHYVAVSP